MQCPTCGKETKIVDSRPFDNDTAVRRRRECLTCGARWTTVERFEQLRAGRPKSQTGPASPIPVPEVPPVVINEVVEPEPEPEPVTTKPAQAHKSPTFTIGSPASKRAAVNDLIERYRDAKRCARGH